MIGGVAVFCNFNFFFFNFDFFLEAERERERARFVWLVVVALSVDVLFLGINGDIGGEIGGVLGVDNVYDGEEEAVEVGDGGVLKGFCSCNVGGICCLLLVLYVHI